MRTAKTATRLVELTGGPFLMWGCGVVRAAGFPVADLVSLGDTEYAAAVDAFLDTEASPGAATAELSAAADRALARQAAALAAVAGRPAFQEAVTWQNHSVVQPMIAGLAEEPAPARLNQHYRKKQRIVAKYWARYCAKNDTVGFFGASCWFRFDETCPGVLVRPGAQPVKSREVFFEGWPIHAIAGQLARDPRIRPWIAPRLNPAMFFTGEVLLGAGAPVPVSGQEAAALLLADGRRPAREIVTALAGDRGAAGEPAGYELLDELAGRGWLCWDLEPPLAQRPERYLYQRLAGIGAEQTRELALTPLRTLDAARARIAAARGPQELRHAIERLDATFQELTAVQPKRSPGRTYGSRQLVYLDCERDLKLRVGRAVVESFARPLSVLLYGARWLSGRLATHLETVVARAYGQLAAQTGSETISFLELMPACGDELFARGRRGADRLLAEFAALWQRLLRMDTTASRVSITADEIWAEAGAMFSASRPGWSYAVQHGVDLLLAARDLDALRAGDVEPVIGEIHIAWNALQSGVFVNAHPDQDELVQLANACMPPRVVMVPTEAHPRCTTRTTIALDNTRDWWLCVSPAPAAVTERTIAMAELQVRQVDGRLEAHNRDGTARLGIADAVGMWLADDIRDAYKAVTAGRPHTPRVTVDRLVVYRETWTVPIAEVPLRTAAGEHGTFAAARRWVREKGFPRFVFVKLSTEMKPFYVDFASPVLVATFATELRTAFRNDDTAQVTISEMYPVPQQAWLPDASGQLYTSELRLQFTDSGLPANHPVMTA